MEQLTELPISDEALDDELAAADAENLEQTGARPYIPDPRILWASEAARALAVVLTRRFGSDFAREVSDEMASRTLSYQAGCPDDQRDGAVMESLLMDRFWDELFALRAGARSAEAL